MACPADSDCIALKLTDESVLDAEWIFAPDSNVFCGPAGLMSPKLLPLIACAQVPDANFTPFAGGFVTQTSPVVSATNPSSSRSMLMSVSVLFGTCQIRVHSGATINVNDYLGVAPIGGLVPGSYPAANSASYTSHPLWGVAGGEVAYNAYTDAQWTCPFPIGPGAGIDVQFERRVSRSIEGFGDVTLRTTFIFIWGQVL